MVDSPAVILPIHVLLFLNALAFGVVFAPAIYFMYGLLFPIWLGLLFATAAFGRILGSSLLDKWQPLLGGKRLGILAEATAALSFAILAVAGHLQITGFQLAGVLYLVCFAAAFALGRFPFVPLLFQPSDSEFRAKNSNAITLLGFAGGCLLAVPGNHHGIGLSVMTQSLTRSAGIASLICVIAAAVATRSLVPAATITEVVCESSQPTPWMRAIILLCIAAFGMTICILPMTLNETYVFGPDRLAKFFAFSAVVGSIPELAMPGRLAKQKAHRVVLLRFSILACAVGLIGFFACVWMSRVRHPYNGLNLGLWIVWLAAIPSAIGLGVMQKALLSWSEVPTCAQKKFGLFSLTVFGASAVVGSHFWSHQERTAFSIPCVLTFAALALSLLSARMSH